MNADPKVNIRLFSIGKDSTLITFNTAGPIIIPAIKYNIHLVALIAH